ncbi:uncharacterized protein KY384_005441 [Bacidia gigantensis]|uniref:uncharacterized protein n=1 Tax=Bacidia gigantensis TaxID=2732470 RepID=UPI001D03C87E|nr:uncharacterized protein KY384_005441 [Bacidia gigantensis]KAG8529960.1 hypothetical protein KY384_005441 [Bacidia gigantensis]
MYNAMLRKGYDGTPEDAVESMVEVHNFLNEGAWNEIEGWEARFSGGLKDGWEACREGEEGWVEMVMNGTWRPRERTQPKLIRFMGRPGDTTPKARFMSYMSWFYPGRFAEEPPFDRHDWFVQRITPSGEKREIRYVIDYYSAPLSPQASLYSIWMCGPP